MNTVIEGLRQIIGPAQFLLADGSYDYAAMIEYFVAAVIVCVVVSSVFRFLGKLADR